MGTYKDLTVYKRAFGLMMEVFELSKTFPKDEMYGLTSQIRRSSRSVCASIAEAYRKRRYPAHFISKVTDSDMENSETQVWLDVAAACKYISEQQCNDLQSKSGEVGRLLNHMLEHPANYAGKQAINNN